MSSTKTFYSLGNNKKLVKLRNSNITTLQLTFVTVYDKGFHIYCRSKQWLQVATLSVQKKELLCFHVKQGGRTQYYYRKPECN